MALLRMWALVVAAVTCLVGAEPPDYQKMWKEFQIKYGKAYNGDEEEGNRFAIFCKNLDTITSVNEKNLSYSLAINQFADLTHDEFKATYMGYIQPALSQLYGKVTFLGRHEVVNASDIPVSVDWSTAGAVTPVKNQGQCGSCWTFSATGALEGAYQIATGKLVSLSEQQIVDCDKGFLPPTRGCGGGAMSAAFTYAHKNELCTESSYPYEAKDGKCRISTCTTGIEKGVVTGYKGLAPVARIWPASEEALKSAVSQQPVSVGIEADQHVFQFYHKGVLDGSCGSLVDHGVLVVGYGTDSAQGDYWKIKNSWGASWGDAGYVRLKRGKGGKGECGVLSSPSYPVVSKAEVVV